MARYQAAQYDDQLTLVEHLDELRTRIIISIVAVVVLTAICFWQDDLLLDLANRPLPADLQAAGPTTLSPTEPFFTTVKLSAYSGILLALPVLLYQAYAFLLPAFSPREKRVVLPFLVSVPFLFIAGVVFAYLVVIPAAANFLFNFNAGEFNIEVRASDYYGFVITTLAAVGILFQIPIGVLSVTRLGIVSPETLRKNRRYAFLVMAVLAMLLPGTDPVTMLISMLPLVVLWELSVQMALRFGKPRGYFDDEDEDEGEGDDGPDDDLPRGPGDGGELPEPERGERPVTA
ncbi:twin-arginine translocase subunit TatC [Thermoleophilia bacterium SCSIO 60948]|nr:twin-arginine translocase subunit TatC [Thermoleophilia bacterium SCSIO 60948]